MAVDVLQIIHGIEVVAALLLVVEAVAVVLDLAEAVAAVDVVVAANPKERRKSV